MKSINSINASTLQEIVRDYLLDPNPLHPLVIWGKYATGKTTIIDNVVAAFKLTKLIQNEELRTDIFDQRTAPFIEQLGINIGNFKNMGTENFAYCDRFTCCRKIWMKGCKTPHIILEGAYFDTLPIQEINNINLQCKATAYLYELTSKDWCEWAEETQRINPYIIQFIRDTPDMFYQNAQIRNTPGNYPTPYTWEEASKLFNRKQNNFCETRHNDLFGSKTIFQAIYSCVLKRVTFASGAFKAWLKATYNVNVIDKI